MAAPMARHFRRYFTACTVGSCDFCGSRRIAYYPHPRCGVFSQQRNSLEQFPRGVASASTLKGFLKNPSAASCYRRSRLNARSPQISTHVLSKQRRVHQVSGLLNQLHRRCTQIASNRIVLGIETSCDDTGAAVVDETGNILGEALHSQTRIHVEAGGIIPPVARDLHRQHIHQVVTDALHNANVGLQDLDAIATTVKPGLILSLDIGMKYAQGLIRESGKPFIPIHHMEAHALTARMIEKIEFPFLVLLISGGHALLAVARNVDEFFLLGKGTDDAPGDAFDKTARRLKLKNLPECSGMSGGQAIEHLAKNGDPLAFKLVQVMLQYRTCNFSFSGIKFAAQKIIGREEEKHSVGAVDVIPSVADVCATFQYFVLHHLAKRVQRALLYCELKGLLPEDNKTLVVSGGVASNMFIRQGLEKMASEYNCRVVCPPPKLCTDNGIMIAWNGMEKLKLGIGVEPDPESVKIEARCPLGVDLTEDVSKSGIKLKRVKLL